MPSTNGAVAGTAAAGRSAAAVGGEGAAAEGARGVLPVSAAAGSGVSTAGARVPTESATAGNTGAAAAVATGSAGAGGSRSSAGAAGGGTAGSAGEAGAASSEPSCPLPSKFAWKSSGVLAEPNAGWVSLKDFTNVVHDNKHLVYMTTHDTGTKWASAMFSFDDWQGASSAMQIGMATSTVAPTLLYFAPKTTWVLAYQWGGPSFSYATADDPMEPSQWAFGKTLYNGKISGSSTGPIDQTLICDDARCYMFSPETTAPSIALLWRSVASRGLSQKRQPF